MDTTQYLKEFYLNYNEDNRLFTRHGLVEFITTMRYISKYLKKDMRILEIGAGTGRYSHYLAQNDYTVDAVELLDNNISIFKGNTMPNEKITITQGNAINLVNFEDNTYDITLLLGPMYHLFTEEDKLKALSEAIRVTKKGGVIFVAYCMGDASILNYGFAKGEIHNIIEKCMLDTETFETFSKPWDIFELYRKEDIDKLRENFNVTQLHYLATDGYACHMKEKLKEMDEETYVLFMNYHLATCERIELTGYSNHTLDIFRKDWYKC